MIRRVRYLTGNGTVIQTNSFGMSEVKWDSGGLEWIPKSDLKPARRWTCNHCGFSETREQEVLCWKCKHGEMIYNP
jgi:hypothetical protein